MLLFFLIWYIFYLIKRNEKELRVVEHFISKQVQIISSFELKMQIRKRRTDKIILILEVDKMRDIKQQLKSNNIKLVTDIKREKVRDIENINLTKATKENK